MQTTINERIKIIRKTLKMNQTDFASEARISQSALSQIEKEQMNPSFETLHNISRAYKIDGNWLINGVGEMNSNNAENLTPHLTPHLAPHSNKELIDYKPKNVGNHPINDDQSTNDYITGANLQVRTVTVAVDDNNEEVIKLVPVFAHAGYLNGFNDPEYIQDLPGISISNLLPSGTYRAFEVRGDSMLDTFRPGDRVIGVFVTNLTEVKPLQVYVVITADEIILKRCVYRPTDRILEAHYDNPIYKDYSPDLIPLTSILEMWRVVINIQVTIANPNPFLSRINDLEKEVKKLKDSYKPNK